MHDDPAAIRKHSVKALLNDYDKAKLERRLAIRRQQKGTYLYELILKDLQQNDDGKVDHSAVA